MSEQPVRIGVALCSCGRERLPLSQCQRQRRLLASAAGGEVRLMRYDNLCAPAQQAALARTAKSAGLDRLVLAGCPSVAREDLRLAVARKTGLPPSAVYLAPVWRPPARRKTPGSRETRTEAIFREARRAVAAVARMPSFSLQKIALAQRAVVIGAGPAGLSAAAALRELGVATTIVEQAAAAAAGATAAGKPRGATLLSGVRLLGLEGSVGSFTLRLATPAGTRRLKAGAIVVAAGIPAPAPGAAPYDVPGVVPLEDLPAAAAALPRRREGRDLAIVLDYALEEGKASSETALHLALDLQERRGQAGNQVHLLCRDLRVASLPLEELYDRAREAGVDVVKHDGPLSVRPTGQDTAALEIRYTDVMLGAPAVLRCDLAGVSRHGVRAAADPALAALLGLSTDALGQLQENNLHLSPEATNRPGIFVVGSCRGQHYLPQIQTEARAAALAVHRLLSPGWMEVELSSPTVDPDKCVLCLTCVRACPYKAMVVDREAAAARSLPEVCQRCGICAGECPAKAIQLPAWSDVVLLSQLQDAPA